MLVQVLNLAQNAGFAVDEIDIFRESPRTNTGFEYATLLVFSLRNMFLQSPSANEALKAQLVDEIIKTYYEKSLPKNLGQWLYKDKMYWLEQKIIKLSMIIHKVEGEMSDERIKESLRFCESVSGASSDFSKQNKDLKSFVS